MEHVINAPGYVNNVVDVINATEKSYLMEQMGIISKIASNDASNIGVLPSASKDVSIKFPEQCLHIINNKYSLNGLKGSKKMQNRSSLLKYQSRFYNVQKSNDVNHRGMKILWNNKLFPLLDVICVESSPY